MMNAAEYRSLRELVFLKSRVARTALDALAAQRRADIEAQMSAIYHADDVLWKEITAEAQRAVAIADGQLAAICAERGIAENLRPSIRASWWPRGENSLAARRKELHATAVAEIEAMKKAGVQAIEKWKTDQLTILISGSLTSAEAITFFDSLPSAEALLPAITVRGAIGDGAPKKSESAL